VRLAPHFVKVLSQILISDYIPEPPAEVVLIPIDMIGKCFFGHTAESILEFFHIPYSTPVVATEGKFFRNIFEQLLCFAFQFAAPFASLAIIVTILSRMPADWHRNLIAENQNEMAGKLGIVRLKRADDLDFGQFDTKGYIIAVSQKLKVWSVPPHYLAPRETEQYRVQRTPGTLSTSYVGRLHICGAV
jgi:hypothetical protein